MNRKKGLNTGSNSIFLGTGTSMTSANGYSIQFQGTGNYSVWRNTNYNFITGFGGTSTAIRSWTATPAIVQGLNKFNLMKVIKTGSNYAFYINSILVTTFSDATYNPSYVSLLFYVGGVQTEIQYNYVILSPGGAVGGLESCPPLNAVPATGDGKDQTGSNSLK